MRRVSQHGGVFDSIAQSSRFPATQFLPSQLLNRVNCSVARFPRSHWHFLLPLSLIQLLGHISSHFLNSFVFDSIVRSSQLLGRLNFSIASTQSLVISIAPVSIARSLQLLLDFLSRILISSISIASIQLLRSVDCSTVYNCATVSIPQSHSLASSPLTQLLSSQFSRSFNFLDRFDLTPRSHFQISSLPPSDIQTDIHSDGHSSDIGHPPGLKACS